MRTLRVLLPLLAVTLAACGGTAAPESTSSTDGRGSSAETPAGDTAGADDQAGVSGEPVELDFTATTLAGEPFEGTSLRGAPAVLWFWAPWCPTCRAQIPTVSGLGEQYAGEVAVVGVGGLDTQGAIEEVAGDIDHVTHLVDDEGVVWKHFRVTAQSTYTVIDADGQIVHEGYLDDDKIEDLVADLAG